MSAGGSGAEGDVDLNIAPIVDCFTVLIAYLLVSMSFISLGIFEAGVAATGPAVEAPAEDPPPLMPISFSVALSSENSLELKLTGGKEKLNEVITLNPKGNVPDLDTLKLKIGEMKAAHPMLKEANISAGPTVRYKSIIKIIEAVKTKLPKVFLASS
ncbi:MAG: biopolymer transporter ExbD [Bdellovibrionales bacterium]|nr:biopolymer transporter ExbD [Oligoflexia bacterium]